MALTAEEQELREAEKLYTQRRLVITDHIEARKRASMRKGTDKIAVVHREFQEQKEITEKWLARSRKQLDSEYADRMGVISADKTRVCQMVEQEIAQAIQVIEADEREALSVLTTEWDIARRRYREALEPGSESALLAEGET
jgi:hypothetical protein